MSAHTPGPWKTRKPLSSIHTEGDPYGRGPMHVADVRGWGHLTGRGGGCAFSEDKAIAIQEANARLIAAAPDLLAACKAHDTYLSVFYSGPESEALHPQAAENWLQMRAAIAKAEGQ